MDLLITGGMIVDGTGRPGYEGAIGICGDRIAIVEKGLARARARRTIDAAGAVVAPGFIDMLGQSALSLFAAPFAVSKVTQGITTEVTGEVESVWPTPLGSAPVRGGTQSDWADLREYFTALENHGTAINLATYVTAGSLRSAVAGERPGRLSPDELREIKQLVSEAMRDGALGLSAALLYPPANELRREELVALATTAGGYGGGYATHLRSESDSLLPAVEEALWIGRAARVPVHIHHLKAAGVRNWQRMDSVLAQIDRARGEGMRVSADMYPYTSSATDLAAVLPAQVRAGGPYALVKRLERADVRRLLATLPSLQAMRPHAVIILSTSNPELQAYVGRSLKTIAANRHQAPIDALLDIVRLDSGRTGARFESMSEDVVRTVMKKPWVSFGTDAGVADPRAIGAVHPRAFGTMPRVLGYYSREEHVFALPEAVRRMTSLAAAQAGLSDRGVLRPGAHADVVVFNADRIRDRASYARPRTISEGVRFVVVNGVIVLEDGRLTGTLPGRALVGPGYCPIWCDLRSGDVVRALRHAARLQVWRWAPDQE